MNVKSVFVCLVIVGLLLWSVYTLFPAYMKHQQARERLGSENRRVLAQEKINERLKQDNFKLQHNSRWHERVAREKYGWVREGEKIYDYSSGVGRSLPSSY